VAGRLAVIGKENEATVGERVTGEGCYGVLTLDEKILEQWLLSRGLLVSCTNPADHWPTALWPLAWDGKFYCYVVFLI
jgi:hypothetical protein